jgi:hypothetical protein
VQFKNLANTIKGVISNKRGVHFYETGCAEEMIYPEEKFSLPEFLDIEGKSHRSFEACETTLSPFYVRSLKNGICYTSGEEVYTSDCRVILEHGSHEPTPPVRWRRFLGNVTRVEGKVAHLGVSWLENNYYHWLVDCLPRLHLIRKSSFRPDFYVISNTLGFQKRWLDMLGIQERQIIPAHIGGNIQADELIMPSMLHKFEKIESRGYSYWQEQRWVPHWIGDLYNEFGLGKERKGKERKGKERKGKESISVVQRRCSENL